MKFIRSDTPTIMDGLVVRYKLSSGLLGDGEISVSRNGICVSGYFPTMSEETMQEFLDTLHKALAQHRHIRHTDQALAEGSIPPAGNTYTYREASDYRHPLDHPLLKA